jgi:hypothetical protein
MDKQGFTHNSKYTIHGSETWDCERCIGGRHQPVQPFGKQICKNCGEDSTPPLIYVMKMMETPYYKIGISTDIWFRRTNLQTASPFDIEIMRFYNAVNFDATGAELEAMLHALFLRFHVRREWYTPDDGALVVLLDEKKLFEAVWHYAAYGQVI